MNYCAIFFVVKIQKRHGNKFEISHTSSFTIDSYGDYLFPITMDIYHELNEYPN